MPGLVARASVPQLLLMASALSYAVFFLLMLYFGQPGLGIAEGFNLPVVLAALVAGPVGGAFAGLIALALYEAGLADAGKITWSAIISDPNEIRLVGYVAVGAVVGYFATRGRRLLADALRVLEDLLTVAGRDLTTAALSSEGLERALGRRLASREPFALLVVEVSEAPSRFGRLRRLGQHDEHVRELSGIIGAELPADAELARVGETRFAVVTASRSSDEARDAAVSYERALADAGVNASVGWAISPGEGTDSFWLYSTAAERVYARMLVRGTWDPGVAGGVVDDEAPAAVNGASR